MIRLFTLIASVLTFSGTLQARTGLSISIQGGPQRTDMRCDRFITENRTGYTAGFGAAHGITDRLAVGLDAMYSNEGRRMFFSALFQGSEQDFRERIGYLKLPAYLRYTLRPARRISFNARLGPQFSCLLHAEGFDRTTNTILFPNTKAAYSNVNLGAMAGLDVNVRLGSSVALSLGLRGDMTFTDTERISLYFPTLDDSYTRNINAGVRLGLHYCFRSAKKPEAATQAK